MIFSKSKNFYSTVHITGPTHNLLVVKLVKSNAEIQPTIKMLPPAGSCGRGTPDANKVLINVVEGLSAANAEFGTNYRVTEIRFVEDDSPNEAVYAYSIRKLIEHIENGGELSVSIHGDDE